MSQFVKQVKEAEDQFTKELPSLLERAAETYPIRDLLCYEEKFPPHPSTPNTPVSKRIQYRLSDGGVEKIITIYGGKDLHNSRYTISYDEFVKELKLEHKIVVALGLKEIGL